jgi:membrane protein implicated in regulation of membrane protease activity
MGYWWFWLCIIIMAIVVEVASEQLVSIWFIPSALIATILDFCRASMVWQVIVFLAISVVGIIIGRRFLSAYKHEASVKTNIDAIIGEKCLVIEKIDNFAGCGQVRVKGNVWSARGVSDDDEYEVGEVLKVVAIEGVKLICKKIN